MYHRSFHPIANSADVKRRERSWVFTAGSRHFAFTRVDYSASFETGHRIVIPRARGVRPTAVAGMVLATLGGLTLIGLAVNSSRAAAGYRYVVNVPVPEAKATHMARPVMPRRAAAIVKAPIASAKPVATTTDDYIIGELDPAPEPAGATSMTAAIGAAMATGRLQQWSASDGSERGFVVVGPAEAKGCRAVSVLTRRDGDSQVERRRECPGGRSVVIAPDAGSDE